MINGHSTGASILTFRIYIYYAYAAVVFVVVVVVHSFVLSSGTNCSVQVDICRLEWKIIVVPIHLVCIIRYCLDYKSVMGERERERR